MNVEVDIDIYDILSEYTDEILEALEDDELMEEIKKRKLISSERTSLTPTPDLEGYELKRFLCDIVGVPYPTSKEEVIELIKSKLKD